MEAMPKVEIIDCHRWAWPGEAVARSGVVR
jgi:hypothetical protein